MYQPESRIDLEPFALKTQEIRESIGQYIVGQESMITLLITALLADGHVLIEGVPGVAKTQTARLLARAIDVDFKRIQFTPDLLPSDITGTSIYNTHESKFSFNKGPLFSNFVLADEINRAPAKTQSALFEAMEERQITADGTTYNLDNPFMVLATQNPVDLEGTYRLPEAQIDRFLFKIIVPYPTLQDEIEIINRHHARKSKVDIQQVKPVVNSNELHELRRLSKEIYVDPKIIQYIASITDATRNNPDFFLGASPRASLAILEASKAFAALSGRDFVNPDDIKFIAPHVLNHRVILSPEKELEGVSSGDYITDIIKSVEIPR